MQVRNERKVLYWPLPARSIVRFTRNGYPLFTVTWRNVSIVSFWDIWYHTKSQKRKRHRRENDKKMIENNYSIFCRIPSFILYFDILAHFPHVTFNAFIFRKNLEEKNRSYIAWKTSLDLRTTLMSSSRFLAIFYVTCFLFKRDLVRERICNG